MRTQLTEVWMKKMTFFQIKDAPRGSQFHLCVHVQFLVLNVTKFSFNFKLRKLSNIKSVNNFESKVHISLTVTGLPKQFHFIRLFCLCIGLFSSQVSSGMDWEIFQLFKTVHLTSRDFFIWVWMSKQVTKYAHKNTWYSSKNNKKG